MINKIRVNCKKFENKDGTVRYALSTKLTHIDGSITYVPVYFDRNAQVLFSNTKVKLNRPFDLIIDSNDFKILPKNEKFDKRCLVQYVEGHTFRVEFLKSDWTPAEKIPTLNDSFIFEKVED